MPFLFIEAPSRSIDPNSPLAFAQSVDGQTVSHSGSASAALLPKPDKGTIVTLVLPVQELSWHRVTLPAISLKDRQRLRAVLQGLLEDQLLEDPASLHLALEPHAVAGQACWVAACRSHYLQQWLQTLASNGLVVQRIVPAFCPSSANASPTWFAIGSEEAPWLVITSAGTPSQTEDLAPVLALPLSASVKALDAVAFATPDTPLLAEPAVYQLAQQRLGRNADLTPTSQRLLMAAQTDWNMAQFQFANTNRDKLAQGANACLQSLLRAPQWRWLRLGLVCVLALNIIGLNAWSWQAKQDLAMQRAHINELLTTTFPQVPVVVDAALQMRQQVQRLQQASGSLTPASFDILAAQVGSQLSQGLLPTEIRYEEARLSLLGLQPDQPAVQQWQSQLQELGILSRWEDGVLLLEPSNPHRIP